MPFWRCTDRNIYVHQTAEHLTLASLGKSKLEPRAVEEGGDRSRSTFIEDEAIPPQFRSKLSDYLRSGYDRGHMYAYSLDNSLESRMLSA